MVEADPRTHCVETLYLDLMDEEREKKSADKHYNMFSEMTGHMEAERRYDALSESDKKKLLVRTVERCRQEEVNRALVEIMDDVHKDILLIMHRHGITGEKKDGGRKNGLGGAEKPTMLPPHDLDEDDGEFGG